MKIQNVTIRKVDSQSETELSDNLYQICNFCDKLVITTQNNFISCLNMSGKKFYCPFCLRNNFNLKSSKNIMILSFRTIISYYYYKFYDCKEELISFEDLEEMVERHAWHALQNPAISYDPFSMLWFLNFNKIGDSYKAAPIKEIIGTLRSGIKAFKLKNKLSLIAEENMWKKYSNAVYLFEEKRERPKGRKILLPTLAGCVHFEKKEFWNITKEFLKSDMKSK
jgi:hypothetical protein